MRIAVLIIALCMTMLVGMQSCIIHVGGNITSNNDFAEGGAVGLLLAFLFVIGAALVLRLPKVSMFIFLACGLLGMLVGSSTEFKDMYFWGGLSFILAVLCYFGARELKRKAAL